jgi:hypothetical protein
MEVTDGAIVLFDDEVSSESRSRIIHAIIGRSPPRTEAVEVRWPGLRPQVVMAHEDTIADLRQYVCLHAWGTETVM